MTTDVILPKVDMDMTQGVISKWHVGEGDTVKKGQVLFEMETDKSAIEIESPADGVVRGLAEIGKQIEIGKVVAIIGAPGEKITRQETAQAILTVAAAPVKAVPSVPTIEPTDHSGGIRATPLARRLARQKSISLSSVAGSGPRGRILAADLEKASVAVSMSTTVAGAELKPLDGMRRTIAQRLTQSKQTVPHFYLALRCDLTQLMEIRERLNGLAPRDAAKNPVWKISVNDFIIKALGLALQRVPEANVTWTDNGILQHKTSDVGVAVAIEGGLLTPVVRGVENKTLSQISVEMKDLATRARGRKLKPEEYQGGSSSVSNLGMFGIEEFSAIINPPQSSILAVGASIEQFVPVNGQPAARPLMTCTLSCDHRAVDGAVGARLLQAFKQLIEEPALMLA